MLSRVYAVGMFAVVERISPALHKTAATLASMLGALNAGQYPFPLPQELQEAAITFYVSTETKEDPIIV